MGEPTRTDRSATWPAWITRGLPEWMEFAGLGDLPGGMRIEEYRSNGDLVVRAEMPGIDPEEDVEITVSDGVLHLSAQRRSHTEESDEEKGSYRSEFRYGRFARTIPLPAGSNEKDVTASYDDGILEVRVPVDESIGTATRVPVTKVTKGSAA